MDQKENYAKHNQLTTAAGGAAPGLSIFGVKDCLRVRDMLSEVDRLREDL